MSQAMNALRVAGKALDHINTNLAAPDGTRIVHTTIENTGSQGLRVVDRPVTDKDKLRAAMKASGAEMYNRATNSVSLKINEALGDPNTDLFISTSLVTCLNAFNIPENTDIGAARTQIVSAAQDFTNSVSSYMTGLKDIKSTLEGDISDTVKNINEKIKSLVSVNLQMSASYNNHNLEEDRDRILRDLAQYVEIDFSIASNNRAIVRTKGGNVLVGDSNHAQITYTQDLDLLSHNNASDIIEIVSYKNVGKDKDQHSIQSGPKSPIHVNDVISNFGGELAGLLHARTNLLPSMQKKIDNVVAQVTSKVNEVHNMGSGFPPLSGLTSGKKSFLTDSSIISGKVNFAVTDDQGKAIKDNNGNYLKPFTVDFDKLYSRNALAKEFTVQDVINEINQVAGGYSKASVGLGSVAVPDGQPPQWLIDQVRLVPSDIGADGAMSFQLEVNSGSAFDTSFQITEIAVYNQAGGAPIYNDTTPKTSITVSAGQNVKTGENIVTGLVPGETLNSIRIKMRVIGSNGLFEESYANFIIGDLVNPLGGAKILNQRVEAIPVAGLPIGQTSAQLTNPKLGGPVLIADFVDANDFSVRDAGLQGYLKISSGNGIIIDSATSSAIKTNAAKTDQAQNFSHLFGLNNFFTEEAVNPAANLAIRPDLVAAPSLIALGKAIHHVADQSIMVGQKLPLAVLEIAVNPMAADADNITVNGIQFNFVAVAAVPANNTDIVIGANAAATTQNIYNTLNANPALRNLITVTPPTAGTAALIVSAKAENADIAVVSSNAANMWKLPPSTAAPGAVLGATVTKLVGGYASAILDCSLLVIANGNTVTIAGKVFQFGAGPAIGNNTLVTTGGTTAETLKNFRNVLIADPILAGLFNFTIDPAHPDQLIATAKIPGFEGNSLTIDSNIAGNNQWKSGGAAPPGAADINTLVGGYSTPGTKPQPTDTFALTLDVKANTNMADLQTQLFTFVQEGSTYSQTISRFFASDFVADVARSIQRYKAEAEVTNKVSARLQTEYNILTQLTKDSRDGLWFKQVEMSIYKNILGNLEMRMQNDRERFWNIIS